jgi:heptosyltransferase II
MSELNQACCAQSERATPKKILVVGPSWVGDMVMAQTLFMLLKQANPGCEIDVLAPDWTRALLERMPEVRDAIALPVGHGELKLMTRWAIGRRLKKAGYDEAFILPNSFKSALVPFFAKIKRRVAYGREGRSILLSDARKLNKVRHPLMIERFMALSVDADAKLVEPYPNPHLSVNASDLEEALRSQGLSRDKPILVLCPAAEFGPAKRWPAAYFAELAKAKVAQGYQVWLFGSVKDQAITASIQAASDNQCIDLAGKTSLAQAIDLMSLAACVVSNDSGLMHIAAALNRPLVALYGSSSPNFTPPLSDRKTVLKLDLVCQPCFQRSCPLSHFRCMRDLNPGMVIEAVDGLL